MAENTNGYKSLEFPKPGDELDQDQEWCEVTMPDGSKRKIRFHDYHEIYTIRGLYEEIFYHKLQCKSPSTVAALLKVEADHLDISMSDLRVLDVGAGNGMVGEELSNLGVNFQVGIDIIPEAKKASERDRPETYETYHIADLTDLPEDAVRELEECKFNCLVSVAALGFGDIPPQAFATAYNFIAEEGLLAFNIRDKFLVGEDNSGFSRLIRRMINEELIEVEQQNLYCHRLSVEGERLSYVAMVARKNSDIPADWFDTMDSEEFAQVEAGAGDSPMIMTGDE